MHVIILWNKGELVYLFINKSYFIFVTSWASLDIYREHILFEYSDEIRKFSRTNSLRKGKSCLIFFLLIIWEDETKRKTWAPWFSLLNCVLHWISKAKHDLIRNMITTWQGRDYSPLQLQFKSISFWKSIYVMLVWFGLNLLHLQLLGSTISFKQNATLLWFFIIIISRF